MFAIATMQGGVPVIDTEATPYKGHVLCGQQGQFGGYIFSGSASQLAALNALPNVVGLAVMTESAMAKWPELENAIVPARRTRLNTWLTARSYPTLPANWTYRQAITAVWRRLYADFQIGNYDILDDA